MIAAEVSLVFMFISLQQRPENKPPTKWKYFLPSYRYIYTHNCFLYQEQMQHAF